MLPLHILRYMHCIWACAHVPLVGACRKVIHVHMWVLLWLLHVLKAGLTEHFKRSAVHVTDELNVSESLLEETSLVREFLTDFSQSSSSVTDTMLTAREEQYTNNEELEETRIETDAADSAEREPEVPSCVHSVPVSEPLGQHEDGTVHVDDFVDSDCGNQVAARSREFHHSCDRVGDGCDDQVVARGQV